MRRLVLALVALAAVAPPSAHADSPQAAASDDNNTVRYAVVTVGRPSGEQIVRHLPTGDVEATYEFNDRGRGPKLTAHYVVGKDGIPTRIEIAGNDYLKSAVDERFTVAGGRATWSNSAEHGDAAAAARTFYISQNGLPYEAGLLAQAALTSPTGRVALYPSGEVRVRRIGELEVTAGSAKRTVVQVAVEGLDFAPSPLWLDRDGTFFGSVSPWVSVIRAGWESAIAPMIDAQSTASAAHTAELAKSLRHVPKVGVAFTGARVFDADTATVRPNTTVVIEGNRITAVGPDGSLEIPSGIDVIDARGKTLLPGLWDMHVHIGEDDGLLDIAAGVTTGRDMGNDYATLSKIRRRFDDGTAVGPRIIMAGLVDGSGPFTAPTGVIIDSPEQAHEVVARLASEGYVQIKIYSSIKPELVPIIAADAHRLGLRVSGHIPAFMTAEQAVRGGYDEIQHANMLFLNFMFDTVKDTRTPARFVAVAEHGAELDLDSERVKAFIALLKEHDTVIDPTLNVFEQFFTDRPGSVGDDYRAIADRLPAQTRRGLLGGGLPVPEGKDAVYRASFERMLQLVHMLYTSGIRIVAGTDAFPGFAYHRELELYVKAGIPAPKVLQLATLGSARVMRRDKELGSIEVGKLADVVLVDGDPTTQISDVRRAVTVVRDGVVFKPAEVYATIGVKP